jgi:NSS family neurotransmitter:Na+ symporter
MARESLSSRLGFIFLSAGCAIGLGNVWRFPFITGKYGGGAFVLIYLVFLLLLGLPVMVMEFSIGRGGKNNLEKSMRKLEKKGTQWHQYGKIAIIGNYLLMMFYTTIAGWILSYIFHVGSGNLAGLDSADVASYFGETLTHPITMTIWMASAIILGFSVCAMGLEKGVEKITKFIMMCLLLLMVALAVKAITLPGAKEGLTFYLKPDFGRLTSYSTSEVIFAAMGQAFFTLSVGMGGMAIFGSYIGKEQSLTGESINVILLDTFVAIMSGLIIFPACYSYGVNPQAGPSLLFITLPTIFNQMPLGRFWGVLFFVFMGFAAMSTLIAVFENIISYWIDLYGVSRKKAAFFNAIALIILSLPCILGFNVLSGIQPLGPGTGILDLEDFLISNTIMPLGSVVFVLFCTRKKGWGFKNFIAEADAGKGIKFPQWLRVYVTYILPIVILIVFIQGYWTIFTK